MKNEEEIVIIGFGTASVAAVKSILYTNRKARITVIEKREGYTISPCGIPFAMEGMVKFNNLKHTFPEHRNIRKLYGIEVERVNVDENNVIGRNIKTGERNTIEYDKLIIATGAVPYCPEKYRKYIHRGIFFVNSVEEAEITYNALKRTNDVYIIGGGAIGIETGISLKKLKHNIHIIEIKNWILPNNLDEDMSGYLTEYLKNNGIELLTGYELTDIHGEETMTAITVNDKKINTEMTIFCLGFKPNINFIVDTGIKTDKFGILTDKHMRTNYDNVYAAGDCVSAYWFMNGKRCGIKLANVAYEQGRIAGISACDGDAKYDGTVGTFVTKIGNLEVASTGFNSETAKLYEYDFVSVKSQAKSIPEWMPNSSQNLMKLIVDKKTSCILGAQAIGEKSGWRMNFIELCIRNRIPIDEIYKTEFAYSPPVSDIYEVSKNCLEIGLKRINRMKHN